jgi:MFS family permease
MQGIERHEKTAYTRLAWLVTLTSALFFFYEFIQMNLFNTINTELREAYQLDALEIGQLFSMYFYANFIFIFFAGNLLDRYSTRRLLLLAVAVSTLGAFIFAVAGEYWQAAVGRFLIGAGAAFCFLSCIRIASRWFSPHRMAFVTGVVVTMAMLGGMVAQKPFAILKEIAGGWRNALYINSLLGVVIIIAIFFVVQDRPPDAKEEVHADNQHLKELGLWGCIKLAMLNPQNWFGGLYTSLMNLPVFVLGGLWGVRYLMVSHQLTEDDAQLATSLFFLGVILGSLVFGWFSDFIERRILPMVIGAIISLAVMAALMFIPDLSGNMVIFLFALIGFTTSSQVLTYPTIAELNPIFLTSTAVSIDSLCIMFSGFVIPVLFGWLMMHCGTHVEENGIAVYTAENFNYAMLVIPASFIIALGITYFMRETYCRSQA